MDREQDQLRFLGFFGIIKESFKIVFTWRKIFGQITLVLILPLSIIFLAHILISELIFSNRIIYHHHQEPLEYHLGNIQRYYELSSSTSLQWGIYWLFKFACFTLLLILALLSTSAVVYTIASIHTNKPISFRRVVTVVPKVWKRLMVTFLWSFLFVFVYNIFWIGLYFVSVHYISPNLWMVYFILQSLAYVVGLLYITIVWHLASVISVLEDIYGIKSMVKSKNLIKGKLAVAAALFFFLGVFLWGIQSAFQNFVVYGSLNVAERVMIGIACFLFLFKLILLVLVIQTVLYFVCKSYHHENIDKFTLSEHLEVYLGFVPLKVANVQMDQMQA